MLCLLWTLSVLNFDAVAHAENNCPWLNEATASWLLGGKATGSFEQSAEHQPAVCTFTEIETGFTRKLTLRVDVVPDAHSRVQALLQSCNTDSAPVPYVGNEAGFCTFTAPKERGQRIFGRVRDQLFSISIGTTSKEDYQTHSDMLRLHLYSAADLISGNLF